MNIAGFKARGFNLLALVAPKVNHAEPILFALKQVVQLALSRAPVGVRCGNGIGRDAAETVEENALLGLVKAGKSFRLGMDKSKLRRELAKNGDSGGLVVDEDTAFAAGENFAPKDDLGAFGVDAVFLKDAFRTLSGFKDAGNNCLFGSVSNNFGRCLTTHEESQRIYKNGLACAGLAREQVQSRAKCGDGVINDGIVFGAQLNEHPDPFFPLVSDSCKMKN